LACEHRHLLLEKDELWKTTGVSGPRQFGVYSKVQKQTDQRRPSGDRPCSNRLAEVPKKRPKRIKMDYSQEGRSLVADLMSKYGMGGKDVFGSYHRMDAVHKAASGGVVYVGGWDAAEDLAGLVEAGVTTVINCTTDLGCPHGARLRYLTFDIAWWKRHTNNSTSNIPRFIQPLLEAVEVGRLLTVDLSSGRPGPRGGRPGALPRRGS